MVSGERASAEQVRIGQAPFSYKSPAFTRVQ